MPYAPVAIPLQFVGGVETKIDSKSVPTTKLISLENGVFAKGTTIQKRNGYDALSKVVDSGGEYASPRALLSRGDELCMATAENLYSYRESTGTWSEVGPCASLVHTERAVAATGTDQSMADASTADGVTVVAWEDSRGGVWWAVVEAATQRILRAPDQIDAGGSKPRVVRTGDRVVLLWLSTSSGIIFSAPVDPGDYLTAPIPVVVTGDLSFAAPFYDAQAYSPTGTALIVWNETGGGYRIGYIDATGSLAAAPVVQTLTSQSDGPVSVAWVDASVPVIAGLVGVTFSEAGDTFAQFTDASNLSNLLGLCTVFDGGNPVRLASAFVTDGPSQTYARLVVWAEYAGASDRDALIHVGSADPSGLVAGPTSFLRGHGLASRGFTEGMDSTMTWISPNLPCVALVHAVPFFPYVALTSWSAMETAPVAACIGRMLVGSSDGLPLRGHLATVQQSDTDDHAWQFAGLARQQVAVEPTTPPTPPAQQFMETGIQLVTVDFASDEAYQHAEYGRDLIIAGACPLRYDGDTVAELGFHTAPDGDIGIVPGPIAGGGMSPSSTYLYYFNYEERDASGEIHPGPMSVPYLVTLGPADNGILTSIPSYRLTSKRRVSIGVWRSVANDQSDDPLLYRVTSLNPSDMIPGPGVIVNGYVLNDPTVDTVNFADKMSDLTLITKERAYTNSGVLSNDPIGLGHIVTAGKDRLFFNDPTDPNIVRYSQARRDGYGAEIPEGLSIRVGGQPITALGVLDDAVLVFGRGSISFFAGPGALPDPEDAPQIGFSPPAIITGDVGCVAARSLAVTPDRVLFQSERGIYQIDRARQVAYVGAPVEAFNGQRIVSADQVPGKTQIVFLTDQPGGFSPLYDYFYDQWSLFTNHVGLDAVSVRGVYHYVRANSVDERVFRASATSYSDAGSDITLSLETAWIKLLGYHQGLQKIWRALFLGAYKSPHLLRVRIATDYQAGWESPDDLGVDNNYDPALYGDGAYGDGPYGGDSDSVYQRRIHLDVKCQAIRFSIEDVTSGTPLGASFELTELLLEGGAVKRTANISAARSS